MNPRGRRFALAFLLLAAAAGVTTHRYAAHTRENLQLAEAALDRERASLHRAQQQIAELQRQLAEVEREIAQARATTAALEASPDRLWAGRVQLMRQLLEEMPGQRIPELSLLSLLDWLQIARTAELDTANRIRTAFVALRSLARLRFSELLRPALRAFVAASGGYLPTDPRQLAPYLPSHADADWLARYEMIRTGKAGSNDEHVLREKPGSDAMLSVGLDTFSISSNSDLPKPPNDTLADAAERISGLFEGVSGTEKMKELVPLMTSALPLIAEKYTAQVTAAFGDDPDVVFKTVGQRYRAANPDGEPTHLGHMLPYFPEPQKFLTLLHHAFADLEYYLQHRTVAPDRAALAPYLRNSFDAEAALRSIQVKLDGESWSMGFHWNASDMTTGFIPRSPAPK